MTKKYIAAAMCAAIALATGCAARDGDSEMPQETAHKSENRTLVGVEYEVVNGMVYGADLALLSNVIKSSPRGIFRWMNMKKSRRTTSHTPTDTLRSKALR